MSEVIKVNEVTKSYNLYNKPIEKSYVVDSSGRIFNLGKLDVNKQADNSIIVAKNSLNFY